MLRSDGTVAARYGRSARVSRRESAMRLWPMNPPSIGRPRPIDLNATRCRRNPRADIVLVAFLSCALNRCKSVARGRPEHAPADVGRVN